MTPDNSPTAAVLLIGNELLSGRTQDTNLFHIAGRLGEKGIRVLEARVVPDLPEVIVSAINDLRQRHTFLFTTGGIGPTHDDITADCVANAFGVPLPINKDAEERLLGYFAERGIAPNEDRMRMARIPLGAALVDNPVSVAPGFRMENVFVFAGVPRIMQAMLESILPTLEGGQILHSVTVTCNLGEGTIASALRTLQQRFPHAELGSYPGKANDLSRLSLVARSTDLQELARIEADLQGMITDLGGTLL
jgi:molybdenum cofactor synthesis domain-containing protein